MRASRTYQVSFIAVIATLLSEPALAQMAASPSVDEANPGLDEVVVVARRVEERLQDVPVTVTAISGLTLAEAQITRGTDLIRLVPSLSVQETSAAGGPQYALRGIRDGVITYFNDVPVNTLAVDDQIWDLSSVQALSGPQGTLFGRTATGGAILFEAQRPTRDFGGYVDASYGNYNYEQLNGVVNLPINDLLQVRLGGRLERHDPMVANIGGGPGMDSHNRDQLRFSMLFEPNSNISNYTVFDYSYRHERPLTQITVGTFGNEGLGLTLYPNLLTLGAEQTALGIHTIDSPYPAYDHATNRGLTNILTASLGQDLTFKYIFGYRYVNVHNFENEPGLALPIEILDQADLGDNQFTDELQLLGKSFDNRLTWTAGLFDLRQHNRNIQNTQLFAPVGEPFSNDTNIIAQSRTKSASDAAYGQATFGITDTLNFTAGGRYTRDTRSIVETSFEPEFFFFGPQTCALAAGAVGVNLADCTQNESLSSHAWTYNASLDYHLTKDVMVYGTTRRGYNGGGFNSNAAADLPPGVPHATYLPEFVTDYEIGAKTEGVVGQVPVRANLSLYKSFYTDIQRESNGVTPSGQTYAGISNGPKAIIYGAVLELVVRPVQDFTMNLNYGFLHTAYVQGAPGFAESNVFGQAPQHTLNFRGTYHHDLPFGGAAVSTISYTYQSRVSFQDNNIGEPDAFQGGYGIADARIGWDSVMNSPVNVGFFVKNLTNKVYDIDLQDLSNLLSFTGAVHNDPRTYGIEVHYRFGSGG
jgi:iron complex outermembrane receptor protein